jgi:RNA polymerase sigma-70 factor (ECF subfamily)
MAKDSLKKQDQELVALTREGNKQAYRMLVERYQSRAYAIAFEILRSREDAQDVVQEAFVKAYLSIKKFEGKASFYTWLYRIVYNLAIDYKRKLSRRGGGPREYDEHTSDSQDGVLRFSAAVRDPQEALYSKEQALRIQEVLASISEEHRTVVMLREIEGMSYEDIAKTLNISKGTVMSRLHYARKKLQEGLKDLAPGASNLVLEGETAVKDVSR